MSRQFLTGMPDFKEISRKKKNKEKKDRFSCTLTIHSFALT